MTIRSSVLTFSMVVGLAVAAGGTPMAKPGATGSAMKNPDLRRAPLLRKLDAEMRRTGRVAVPDLHGTEPGIPVSASIAKRPETRVRMTPVAPPPMTPQRISLRDDPTLDFQYGRAFAESVEECRLDVARHLGVTPTEILAGAVTLRWTIEPSGQIRDVSAVASSPTDGAVLTCARRVVTTWVLLTSVEKAVALEWTYTFRNFSVVPEPIAARENAAEDG
jgi:hypothetical protein